VKRNMICLAEAPTSVFKLATIARKVHKGCDLDFAASLLHHAGMLAACSWKKAGAVGYPGQLFNFLHGPALYFLGTHPGDIFEAHRLLGPSWAALGPVLGCFGARIGALLGRLGAVLRPLKPVGIEKARRHASIGFRKFGTDVGFSGAILGGS